MYLIILTWNHCAVNKREYVFYLEQTTDRITSHTWMVLYQMSSCSSDSRTDVFPYCPSKRKKCRLMKSPSCLCVCLSLSPYKLAKQSVDFYEIQYWSHGIEADLDAIILNPIAACIQNSSQTPEVDANLAPVNLGPWNFVKLLIRPLLQKPKIWSWWAAEI